MAEKLDALIGRIENFLLDYCAFPNADQAFVVALWCIGTWCYRKFDAFPYLVITAATKQAGKTRLSELMAFVSCNSKQSTAMTPAVMFQLMAQYADPDQPERGVTLFYDEAESLSGESQHGFRQVLNSGYRRGQTVLRTSKNGLVEYPVYCPKAFVLIGDVFDTLRDRSIIIELQRGTPRKLFDWSIAEAEATELAVAIQRTTKDLPLDSQPVQFLTGREREIWAPLFALARAARIEHRLVRAAADFSALKTQDKRRYSELLQSDSEQKALNDTYAKRALVDLARAMAGQNTTTDAAVTKMKALDDAPWRTFRGVGLDARQLAILVRRFNVQPRSMRIKPAGNDRSKHAPHSTAKGYYADDVRIAVNKLGKES